MTQPTPADIAPTSAIPGLITPTGTVPQSVSTPQTGASLTYATVPGQTVPPPVVPAAPTPTPTPAPAPAPPVQPLAPAPASADPQTPAAGADERGYPQDTPLDQMTTEQREAYWRFHSRKWERIAKERGDYDTLKAAAGELEQLRAANATEQEKAIAAARSAGYSEAASKAAVILVDAHVRAGLTGRMTPDQLEAYATHLDHKHFLGADGMSVDAEKVAAFVNAVAPPTPPAHTVTVPPGTAVVGGQLYPAAPQYAAPPATPAAPPQPGTGLPRALPDLGQGSTAAAKPSGLAAGREIARARFGDQNTQRA